MKLTWDIRSVYLYLISFVTLILVIVNVVNLGRNLVDMIIQQPGYSMDIVDLKNRAEKERISFETVQQQINLEQELAEKNARYWATKRVIESLASILVIGPVYLYHWRKIRKEIMT